MSDIYIYIYVRHYIYIYMYNISFVYIYISDLQIDRQINRDIGIDIISIYI